MKIRKFLTILGVYLGLLLLLEGTGQLAILYLESKAPTGLFGEDILSHNEPVIGFGLQKNISHRYGHWVVETNSLGFRNESFPEKKEKNEYRIFVVGGSTIFGWGSEEKDSIPRFLSKLITQELSKRGRENIKVRVINAGVPWYASWHETAQVLFRIMPLDPDWILLMDGLNDVAAGIMPNWNPIHLGYNDRPTQVAYKKRLEADREESKLLKLAWMSPSFRYFYSRWKTKALVQEGVFNPGLWDQYLGYMNHLRTLTQKRNIGFSVFLQPVIVLDHEITEEEHFLNASSLKVPQIADSFRKLYLEGEQRLQTEATFNWHSLKSVFKDEKRKVYIDGLHYTGGANWKIAKNIFDKEILPNFNRILQSQTKSLALN